LRQICGALSEAHQVGLVHRDIKPGNIFVSQRGGEFDVAKLLDFGLVREAHEGDQAEVTSGSFSGTPLYMSPEQASGYDRVDGRADLYSLGAVAYQMLTGQPPFSGEHVLDLIAAHRDSVPQPPSAIVSKIPVDLEQIILKCLSKEPSQRYPDANALRTALAACSIASEWDQERAIQWWRHMKSRKSTSTNAEIAPTEFFQS
jgi:serine/threonine-protein kinase